MILLPLFKRICPQILKEIIWILRLEARHIEGARNAILPWKIDLVSIVVDLLKYFKWTIGSRH